MSSRASSHRPGRARGIALVLAGVAIVLGAGLFAFRDAARALVLPIAFRFLAPSHGFDMAYKAPAPDYASPAAWAARPDTQDRADYVPAGLAVDVASGGAAASGKPVDVFFVHPTTYLRGGDWNDPMASGTATEENTQWTLANQASVYNGCCDVYAPRYRQASILFLGGRRDIAEQALALAYGDVERAFDYFLANLSHGRPFILASHSQGTIHLRKLLRQRITGTPLAQRLVAAYLLGGGVLLDEIAALPDLHACQSATDLNCIVHWETYGPEGRRMALQDGKPLCTNPLSWKADEEPAPASANLGSVQPSGTFNPQMRGDDVAQGVAFDPLGAPEPGHTDARCKDGTLIVQDQSPTPFGRYANLPGQNYHGLDYALFYMNLRSNAIERVAAYVASPPQP